MFWGPILVFRLNQYNELFLQYKSQVNSRYRQKQKLRKNSPPSHESAELTKFLRLLTNKDLTFQCCGSDDGPKLLYNGNGNKKCCADGTVKVDCEGMDTGY